MVKAEINRKRTASQLLENHSGREFLEARKAMERLKGKTGGKRKTRRRHKSIRHRRKTFNRKFL